MILQLEIFVGILISLPLIILLITIGIFILFLREYFITRQKMFLVLSLLFLAYLLLNFFQFTQVLANREDLARFNFILVNVFTMITLYCFVLVLEMFEKNIDISSRQTIMSILILIAIGGMIINPQLNVSVVNNYYLVDFQQPSLISIIQNFFYLITGIWLIIMIYRNRKSAWSQKQKLLLTWLSIGVIFAILLPTTPFFFEIITQTLPIEVLIGSKLTKDALQDAGMLIIGITFILASKSPWLLQRQRIQLIAIYSKSGIELYSKSFNEDITVDDLFLLCGGFSAVSSLFQEVIKVKGGVKAILLEGKELRVINRETFICVLLVEYSTDASELAHKKFTDLFEDNFSNELKHFSGNTKPFEKAEEFAKQFFS